MTNDETETSPENLPPDPVPDSPVDDAQLNALIALETEGLNVDEALAAVASLSELVTQHDAQVEESAAEEETSALEDTPEPEETSIYEQISIAYPPLLTLQRGQMNSVLPALLLIGLGVWLTFTLTTSEAPPDPLALWALLPAGLGAALVAHWLSSGGWSRGALFVGLNLILLAGAFVLLFATGDLARGYPLLGVGAGAAALLTGILSSPRDRTLIGFGGVIALASALAWAVTTGLIDKAITDVIASVWYVPLAALAVVWLLPFIFKRRE